MPLSIGLDGKSAIMIGDRRHDILAAKQHLVESVGVLWGFGDREELVAAGADRLCASVTELSTCCLDEK